LYTLSTEEPGKIGCAEQGLAREEEGFLKLRGGEN
jgi:hypothetical protein